MGVAHGDQRDAFTAAWVTQVSFDPLLLALSINPSHASFPILVAAGAFVVSVLGQGQLELALKLTSPTASTSSTIRISGSR